MMKSKNRSQSFTRLFAYTLTTLGVLSLLVLLSSYSLAQAPAGKGGAGGTGATSQSKQYLKDQHQKAEGRQDKAKQRIEKRIKPDGTVTKRGKHKHDGGVIFIEHQWNGCLDTLQVLGKNFIGCQELKFEGICWKINRKSSESNPPALISIHLGYGWYLHLRPRWSYHFPAEVGEIARIKGISRFADILTNKMMIPLSEKLDYIIATNIAQMHLRKAHEVGANQVNKKVAGSTVNPQMGVNTDIGFINKQVKKIKKVFDKSKTLGKSDALRVSGSKGTDLNKEYHLIGGWGPLMLLDHWSNEVDDEIALGCPIAKVLSQMETPDPGVWKMVLGLPPKLFHPCHKFPKVWDIPYMSEYPSPDSKAHDGLTPYHLSKLMQNTENLTATGPNRNYKKNMERFYENPLGCLQDNDQLKTKVEKIFPGLVKQKDLDSNSKGGCYTNKDVQVRAVSATTKSPDAYEAANAEATALKSMHVAFDMFPEIFCDFNYKKDKIQWFMPKDMPDDCRKIGEDMNSAQAWGDANIDEEEDGDLKHDFASYYKWRRMKACCPKGWNPDNQYKCWKKN